MNYKVYNTDTNYWMTYRKDYDGHYSVVHEGLPSTIGGYVYPSITNPYDEDLVTYRCVPCYHPKPKRVYHKRRCNPYRYCPLRDRRITEFYLNY